MVVPLGSSCGPVLWRLVINGVLNMRNIENDAYIQAYADDIVVMLRSTVSYHFTNMSKPIMKKLEEWASSYKLSFSKEKTKNLMFKFRNKITHFPSFHLYNSRISHDKELKYLGIRLDPNLSFIPHLNKVLTNICTIYEKARRIERATWGLRPGIVKEIYSVIIERIVTYGSEIWYRGTVEQKNKLLQIQRIPLITITKCYTTVSNESLKVLSGCAPLDLKIELEIEVAKQIKIIKKEEIYEGFQNFDCEELMKPWDTISIGWIYFEPSVDKSRSVWCASKETISHGIP
ncbi:Retrovirus-related Pol polyprotein from type-1 retrotransposable element R1 [Araneus ventricosus]|uniref:Retrovirus-related Pol polyprotein from type-1 retrotransposable element R1 n=1 Tax=Araneus ventricosus TaxID=182803 RepID=A0A4Y2E7E7_ARAVE|nr:Retrovirus-related Pol polyprotein from type-1 retrotransposable element R1 [Araneus ventricosus]